MDQFLNPKPCTKVSKMGAKDCLLTLFCGQAHGGIYRRAHKMLDFCHPTTGMYYAQLTNDRARWKPSLALTSSAPYGTPLIC